GEPGADDGRARLEGGLDDLAHQLSPGRVEEQGVGERVDRLVGLGEEDLADALPEDGAARLARREDRDPAVTEGRGEAGRPGRLGGAPPGLPRDAPPALPRRGR